MRRIRIIPILLLQNGGVYKTVRFSNPSYIGDPINAVKIFNEKEVDELIVLDFKASVNGNGPDFKKLEELASEAFMPMGYGGAVRSVEDMRRIIFCGYEKIVINTSAFTNKAIIREGASLLGSQSIVVSVDYKNNIFGRPKIHIQGGKKNTGINPIDYSKEMEDLGAGELILHSIDRDGMYNSYDFDLINKVSNAVGIPIVACGGASCLEDFYRAIQAGASAVAAGSLFVYHGKKKGVLLNYPSQSALVDSVFSRL